MNIVITMDIPEEKKEQFLYEGHSVVWRPHKTASEADVRNADIIIGNISLDLLNVAEKLRYLHLSIAGSDLVAAHPTIHNKVTLTNSSGCFSLAISEHMVGMVLYFYKNLGRYTRNQIAHLWQSAGETKSIDGAQVLVIGCGDIGMQFAKRMHALGAHVTGIKRTPGEKPVFLEALYQNDKLEECLRQADIVALALPQNADTRHLLNQERLALLKQDALIINVGRGSAVDTDALLACLREKKIMGAALDVFEEEPLPVNHPLWNNENVLILPHVTGTRNLAYTRELLVELASYNLHAYLFQEPLKNIVDSETGYRKSNS